MQKHSFNELATQLTSRALPKGGWSGKSSDPSITVSSEVLVALIEHLDQMPATAIVEQKALREEIQAKIEMAIGVVEATLIARPSLDVPNCALALSAYAVYREFRIRSGQNLPALNRQFLGRILDRLGQLPADLDQRIGSSWAFINAVEITQRALAFGRDNELMKYLAAPAPQSAGVSPPTLGEIVAAANTVRTRVLSRDGSLIDGYASAVLLDLALSTLASPLATEIQKASAIRIQISAADFIVRKLSTFRASDKFPIWLFENSPQSEEYHVVIRASLLNSLAKMNSEYSSLAPEIAERLQLSFYSVASSMPEMLGDRSVSSFKLAHCLRVLAEVQVSERDVSATMRLLRERERRPAVTPEVVEVAERIRDAFGISFGSPSGAWFLYASPRLYLALMLLLNASFFAQLVLLYYGSIKWAFILCVVWVLGLFVPTSFYAWSRTNLYQAKPKDERLSLWVQFVLTGPLAGVALISALFTLTTKVLDAIKSLP
jgi:hypothetical protein